jgi:hypothetical protein
MLGGVVDLDDFWDRKTMISVLEIVPLKSVYDHVYRSL